MLQSGTRFGPVLMDGAINNSNSEGCWTVPLMLEIGKEAVQGEALEDLLIEIQDTAENMANVDTLFAAFCYGDSVEFEGDIYYLDALDQVPFICIL